MSKSRTASYPSAPPFPHQATHNIAQAHAVAGPDEPETVTLVRDGVHRLRAAAGKYLAAYSPSGPDRGRALALHGEHGAGKTHAIWFVMQDLDGRAPSFADSPKPGAHCQLYAKIDGPDPLQLYRSLAGGLGIAQLKELSRAFLAVVAAEQGLAAGDRQARQAVVRQLRDSPELVDDLLETRRLEPGAVREGGAREIERIGEDWRDFERAVSGLRKPKLARVAQRFLCGEALTADELDRLGVARPVDSPETALLGLRILARLFRRAEIPLVVYLDQVEGLVLEVDGMPVPENLGLLRSLVEVLPQEGAFLVVAGNLEAWRAYPRDVRQRFAEAPIVLPALGAGEAEDLLVAYQAPFKPRPADRADALYPFRAEAVPELLRSGGGSVRRFLQNCALAFADAFPARAEIGPEAARAAVERAAAAPVDRAAVVAQARRLLGGRGLSAEEDVPFGEVRVDLAVRDGDGRPVAVVKVDEAIFRAQEAQDVRDALELVRRAKTGGDPLHVVLVVLGYVSPDMTRVLEEVADDTLVWSADGFELAFSSALSRIPLRAPASRRGEADGIGERIEELQRALIDVLAARRRDDERVQAQIDALARRQEEERAQLEREEARKSWIAERARLERDARDARLARARAEVDAFERMRAAAESHRAVHSRRSAVAGGAAAVLVLVAALVLAVAHGGAGLVVALAGIALAGAGGYLGWRELQAARRLCPAELRELTAPVASEAELSEAVARAPAVPLAFLRSPYPELRYGAAVAAAGGDARAAEALARALPRERSAIVRRALARSLGTSDVGAADFYETHELVGIPEVAYIADESRGDASIQTSRLFAAVKALRAKDDRAFLRVALQHDLDDVTVMKLAEGQRRGSERLGTSRLRDQIPERSRRGAIELLSPFDDGGLGTLDQLAVVQQVDAWYLFFREMEWYAELGWADWKG